MDQKKLTEIYNKIKEYQKIIIFPHARPDGDCIGSSFGLKDIITRSFPNKEVHVAGESSVFTKFIGTPEQLEDNEFEGALGIALDTANKDRLAEPNYELCDFKIKIDHHIEVESYGDISYVDTGRPAVTLIILDLFKMFENELKMTKKGANALFFGTLTDTGRFKYEGVNAETFRNVAILYDNGVEAQKIYQYLDTKDPNLLRFKGYLLNKYKKTPNGVAYFMIKNRMVKKFNITKEQASSLVNELSVFEDCPVWLLFAEYEDKVVRCRLRSKGPAINELANKYDGGGHKMASGANLGTWKRAKLLLRDANQLVKEYKEGQ